MENKTLKATIILAFFCQTFLSCAPQAPIAIEPGVKQCTFCLMGIVDLRFDAQLQSKTGKLHFFDSSECLLGYVTQHHDDHRAWVSDFYNQNDFIDYQQAFYLVSGNRASPMGANLSNYNSQEQLQRAIKEVGGENLDLKNAHEYIKQQWQYLKK